VRAHRFPTKAEWRALIQELCIPKVTKYLGRPLDPSGRYYVSGIRPGRESWDDGHRKIHCSIASRRGRAGDINAMIGRVDPEEQFALGAVGTCVADNGKARSSFVDCRMPHQAQITGVVPLDHTPAHDEYEFQGQVSDQCRAITNHDFFGLAADEELPGRLTHGTYFTSDGEAKCELIKLDKHGNTATVTGWLS
jgi:hypothetical protein